MPLSRFAAKSLDSTPYPEGGRRSMATQAQIAANQANAQLSTGPRSAQGKAHSSMNNLRYGFRSQSVLLPGDDPAEYEALLQELSGHFTPRDLSEQRMVREMADAEWRLRRVRQYQEKILALRIKGLDRRFPGSHPITLQALAYEALLNDSRAFAQFLRYETKYERQYNTAHNQWCAYRDLMSRKENRDAETALMSYLAPPIPTNRTDEPNPAPAVAPENVTDEPNSAPTIARNALCPCGSGEKYKRCCGKNAPPILSLAA